MERWLVGSLRGRARAGESAQAEEACGREITEKAHDCELFFQLRR